jgi:hypothetical protein
VYDNKCPGAAVTARGRHRRLSPMQAQSNETVAERDHQTERTILTLLLSDGQCVWSVEELVAEIGRRLDTTDAVAALNGAGLIHRCGEFVFATRAAIRFDVIEQQ